MALASKSQLALMSYLVYEPPPVNQFIPPIGWVLVPALSEQDSVTGLGIDVYQNVADYVVAFRGTDLKSGFWNGAGDWTLGNLRKARGSQRVLRGGIKQSGRPPSLTKVLPSICDGQ